MARPPVSIQDRQRKGVTTYEVWVNRKCVADGLDTVEEAHEEADRYGGAPGWGRPPPVDEAEGV